MCRVIFLKGSICSIVFKETTTNFKKIFASFVALTGFLVFIPTNHHRATLAIMVCVFSVCALNYVKPHISAAVFWCEELAFGLTCFKFLVSLIIQGGGQRDGGQSFMGVVLICLDVSFAVGSLILLLTMLFLIRSGEVKNQIAAKNKAVAIQPTSSSKRPRTAIQTRSVMPFKPELMKKIVNQAHAKKTQNIYAASLHVRQQKVIKNLTKSQKRLEMRLHRRASRGPGKKNKEKKNEGKKNEEKEKEKATPKQEDTHSVDVRRKFIGSPSAVFHECDLDSNGTLEPHEVKTALSCLGSSMTADEFQVLFDRMDKNKDGSLSFLEFQKVLYHRIIFVALDADVTGYLDATEIREAFAVLFNKTLSDKDFDKVYQKMDKNGDGTVNFKEFKNWFKKHKKMKKKLVEKTKLRVMQEIEEKKIAQLKKAETEAARKDKGLARRAPRINIDRESMVHM